MERKNLLLGAGHSRDKKMYAEGKSAWDGKLITLDMNPDCGADVVWDMGQRPLPFPDEEFDEIHAYDSLEHWGRQGDWRGWFDEMGEYHRLLKPGGEFTVVVPVNTDWFADPGHTRMIDVNHFAFLEQSFYDEMNKRDIPATDYRWYWKKNFKVVTATYVGQPVAHHLGVRLRKE